jgi:glucose dehydrogenase
MSLKGLSAWAGRQANRVGQVLWGLVLVGICLWLVWKIAFPAWAWFIRLCAEHG